MPASDVRGFLTGRLSVSSGSAFGAGRRSAPDVEMPATMSSGTIGGLSNELIATTSSLNTSWGSDRANSARDSDDLIYSAAHERRSLRIEEPSGVSFQT